MLNVCQVPNTHRRIFMKNIALMSLITLLVSCGGGNGSSAQKPSSSSASVSPLVTSKKEYLKSLRPGKTTELSQKYSIYFLDESGNPDSQEVEREMKRIVLKIDGDTIYTLETKKDPESEHELTSVVLVQSISRMISEAGKNSKLSIKENQVTEKYKLKSSWKDEMNSGEVVTFTSVEELVTTYSLENFGCSVNTSGTVFTAVAREDVVTELPPTDFSSVSKCGADIKMKDLKELDLTNVIKCDYTKDLKDEELCTDIIDMSDLLK